ncbi:hypothetical protein DPEC_G00010080 [Dallia pectoralis]|uniref:Uncharacterized protein n=1 Tax=Dallia pectoralis TaxID=75939 RepID=A0ACC2HL47_DALPE|nr:hypothetical protein DPEC_G00010080 [Dallia pectoralis]
MNPDSLDWSIQNILSVLYPPFEATASTVLSQLFQVIEERYQGDPLPCLLDFLIPAKHILQSVQQAACVQYSDVVYHCEGWPLCLHDKVVFQLASINLLLLRPGDFYLQVEPFSEHAARIVVRSLQEENEGPGQKVEVTPIPETSYPCIFTEDWLAKLNQGRHGTPLSQCVLSTDRGVEEVTFTLPPSAPGYSVETRISPAKHGIAVSLCLVDSKCSRLVKLDQRGLVTKPIGWVSPTTWDSRSKNTSDIEGEYVDLVEFTKDKEALLNSHTQPRAPMCKPGPLKRAGVPPALALPTGFDSAQAPPPPLRESSLCGRTVRFSEEPPCTPCMRKRMGQVSRAQELRCRYRESYHSALQNPVKFEKNNRLSTLAILDERQTQGKDMCPGLSQQCCHSEPDHADQNLAAGNVFCRESDECNTTSSIRVTQELWDTLENNGRCPSSLSTTVVDTSEKCEVVIQGRKINSDIGSSTEIPSLHVVKCKNATAFRLVSPKTSRRTLPKDVSQAGQTSMPSIGNVHQNSPLATATDSTQMSPDHHGGPKVQSASSAEPSTHPLCLGIACLTGGRDRTGRMIVEVYGDQEGWRSPLVSSLEFCKLLLYFHSVTRGERRDLGITLVIDARKTPPPPQFNEALLMVEEQVPNAVHTVLILMEKESRNFPQKSVVVTSLKALYKLVEGSQLTSGLGGSLPYSHTDWLQIHKKLHPFMSDLQETSGLLLGAIRILEESPRTDTVQDVQECISKQRTLMKDVLEDRQLVALEREGGAILARLRREIDLRYANCRDYRDAVDSVTYLYNQVEEQAHVLVKKSNLYLEHLEYLLQQRQMEDHFNKIREWFNAEGEQRLLEAESVGDSREKVEQTLHSFSAFRNKVNEHKQQAIALLTKAEKIQGSSTYPETELFRTMVCTFKSCLADFLSRAERCCSELKAMVTLCNFCEQATELANDCRQYLDQKPVGRHPEMNEVSTIQMYQESFGQFSSESFQQVKAQACALRGSRGMRVWNVAWLKCQEVRQQLEESLYDIEKALRSTDPRHEEPRAGAGTHQYRALSLPGPEAPQWNSLPSGSMDGGFHGAWEKNSVTCCNINFRPENKIPSKGSKVTNVTRRPGREPKRREANGGRSREAATIADSRPIGCEWFSWQRGGLSRSMSEDSCTTATSSQSETCIQTPSCSHGQPSCRILQAAQKFQISRHGSFCSEESCSCRDVVESAPPRNTSSFARCEGRMLANPEETTTSVLKLQRIMEELLLTEREYVRSLGYILTHYLPLLEMPDVPQDLRGKRGVIFGNLEKLYDFHCHLFLRELEDCQTAPLRVACCFLRHRDSLGLYALYSKNKPQSDALILHHRHDIFKRKQKELGDHMDLSSYLLRPIQRISKYSLLLQDMLGVSGPWTNRDRAELQSAADLVRFQMRHGNDLLTMDAIQDCDVNLKEQGQLIRQDDFIVFFRKKKCLRRVFLFQDLILFSKTKKTDVGNDVYIYKQSFKTSDIGMTHNSGESGLCFEIWFRRRKTHDTYTLKADKEEIKRAWTTDLEQILWEQAAHSRELRIQERVFMGMGRKPFMNIRQSDASDCDTAVNSVLLGAPEPCCPQTDVEFLRPNSIGSGSSASTTCSQSSSSSGRGSLPPVGNLTQGAENNHIVYSSPESQSVAEDDLKYHHSLQKQNLLLDSTESSGESAGMFSSSELSCLSAIGGEMEDVSSITSQSSQHQERTTAINLRTTSSPATIRKKLSFAPKPEILDVPHNLKKVREQQMHSSMGNEMTSFRKSTEV